MAYCKSTPSVVFSHQSDYSQRDFDTTNTADYTLSSPTAGEKRVVIAPTAGVTIALTHYTSIELLAVKNKDATNYVDVGWTDQGANANTQRIPAGGWFQIPGTDATAAVVLTANTANVLCELFVAGIDS